MSEREVASRVVMMPRDTDGEGNIFGGVLLSNIDLAAAKLARQHCAKSVKRVVTRAMGKIDFKQPVLVNDALTCYAEVTRVGTTSIGIHVDVVVDRGGVLIPATQADLVFVATDGRNRPVPVDGRKPPRSKPATKAKPAAPTQSANARGVLAIRKTMMPHELNGMGDIFGGTLLSYMDLAGAYVAKRACSSRFIDRVAIRFMDKVEFKKAVHVNDVLSCYGTVTNIGRTSISVHVEVEVNRGGKIIEVTAADIVYVAVNKKGKGTPVRCGKAGNKPGARVRKCASRCGKQ